MITAVGCRTGGGEVVPADVIAQVGDQVVLRSEFVFFLESNYATILEEEDGVLLSTIMDDYLERRCLVTYLHEKGNHPTEEEIADYLRITGQDALLTSYDLEQKRLLALNTSLVLAEDKFANMVEADIDPPSEEAEYQYYEHNINEFLQGETICFVRLSSTYEDLLKDARYWMVSRKKDLDFIRERFQDVQIEEDCFEVAEIPDVFLKTLQELKPGRVSQPVEMQMGQVTIYSMFRVKQNIPARRLEFSEVQQVIEHKLHSEAVQTAIQNRMAAIMRQKRITVYPEHVLVFNYTGKFPVSHGEEE